MLFIFLIDLPTQISHKSEIMMDESKKKKEKKNAKEKRAKQKIETNKKKTEMTKEVVKE